MAAKLYFPSASVFVSTEEPSDPNNLTTTPASGSLDLTSLTTPVTENNNGGKTNDQISSEPFVPSRLDEK